MTRLGRKIMRIILLSGILLAGTMVLSAATTNELSLALQKGLFEEEANHDLEAAIKSYQGIVSQSDKERKLVATAVFRLGECYRKQGKTNEARIYYERVVREFPEFKELAKASSGQTGTSLGVGNNEVRMHLDKLIAETEADYRQQKTLLDRMKSMSRSELMKVLPTVHPDPGLSELLLNLSQAETKLAQITPSLGKEHPDYRRAEALVQTSSKRVDEAVEGILGGMSIQVDALKARLDNLQKQVEEGTKGRTSRSVFTTRVAVDPGKNATATVTDEETKELRHIQAITRDSPDLINSKNQTAAGTLLHQSAQDGDLLVLKFLLDNGAEVDPINKDGMTPLHLACRNGRKSIAELLLQRGAQLNVRDSHGATPLLLAVYQNFGALAEVLITKGADVNIQGYPDPEHAPQDAGASPLHLAAGNGATNLMTLLLKQGAKVNARDNDRRVPLHRAAETTSAVVDLLLANGAEVDATNKSGGTPLHTSASYDRPDIAAVLLAKGAKINARTVVGRTPLFEAIFNRQMKIIPFLLEKGADPNIPGDGGITPLQQAVRGWSTNIVTQLIEHHAAIDTTTTQGTALLLAIQLGRIEIVRLLLDHGADVNLKWEPDGMTALYSACDRRNLEIVDMLLRAHVDVNAIVYKDQTALDRVLSLESSLVAASDRQPIGRLAEMLRAHGAKTGQEVLRTNFIFMGRNGKFVSLVQKDTNNYNDYTLFEMCRGLSRSEYGFPNLEAFSIERIDPATGATNSITINLQKIFQSGDCKQDQWLHWGDKIIVPELDHPVSAPSQGPPREMMEWMGRCTSRTISIRIKGKTHRVRLGTFEEGLQSIVARANRETNASPADVQQVAVNDGRFYLAEILPRTGLLRASSDATHVTVKRLHPLTGKPQEFVVDASNLNASTLWLRDGDLLEVPDKQ
jgi:ankyrin repeat protein